VKRVYIAGPYSQGDVAINVRNAYLAAHTLADAGFAPFVPHHTHFWHLLFPRPYEDWIRLDLAFLPCCDALLRLQGASAGADMEVARAQALGIPVFNDVSALIASLQSHDRP
jgi:hypothetical protein